MRTFKSIFRDLTHFFCVFFLLYGGKILILLQVINVRYVKLFSHGYSLKENVLLTITKW